MEKVWPFLSKDMLKQNFKSNYAMILESRFPIFLIVFSIWLFFTPYIGIWHDARFYLLLAYHALRPEIFSQDLWFIFGSQGDASLFDEFYARVIRLIGVSEAAQLLALVGGALYCISIIKLAKLINTKSVIFIAIALIAIPFSYNLSSTFNINENFTTPRIYAISLTIIAMCYWLSGKYVFAFCCSTVALFFHPIMAVWGLCVLMTYYLKDKFIVIITFGCLGGLFLLTMLEAPFFAVMEPLWVQLVTHTSAIVFVNEIESLNIDSSLWSISVLLLATKFSTYNIQRLFLSVAFVGAWAWFSFFVITFYLPAELPSKLQIWRALWLPTFLAPFAFFILWQSSSQLIDKKWFRLGLIYSFAIAGYGGGLIILMSWFISSIAKPKHKNILFSTLKTRLSEHTKIITFATILIFTLLSIYLKFSLNFDPRVVSLDAQLNATNGNSWLTIPLIIFIALSLILNGFKRIAMITLCLSLALANWDQRSTATKTIENLYSYKSGNSLTAAIPLNHTIYWPGNSAQIWFIFNRSAYAISEQGVGIVFSKEHAYLLYNRLLIIREKAPKNNIETDESIFNLHNPIYHPTTLSESAIRGLCSDKDLGVIIYHSQFENLPYKTASYNGNDYHLYFCSEIR